MFNCPKCNKENIIVEPPKWYISKLDKICFQCHCVDCEIDFNIVGVVSEMKVIKKSIRKNKYIY